MQIKNWVKIKSKNRKKNEITNLRIIKYRVSNGCF